MSDMNWGTEPCASRARGAAEFCPECRRIWKKFHFDREAAREAGRVRVDPERRGFVIGPLGLLKHP